MIELDQETSNALNQGMEMGGGIMLPFIAPTLWALNGKAELRQIGGAQYFGGWAANRDDIEDALQQNKLDWLPGSMKRETFVVKGDKEIEVYTSRGVLVAPIGLRKAWLTDDGRRLPAYTEGVRARQHAQALVLLAGKDKEGIIHPWGPAVLSAKGYQATNLLDALGAWDKHTKSIRRQIAPNVPAWCFYLAIGTFGNERKGVMVGKNGAQSSITPIGPYLPETITPETMEALFVGQETAAEMAIYLADAREWLDAWKVEHKDSLGQAPDGGPDPVEPNYDNEVPF